ncbi:MAG: hypothetical protein ABI539_03480 [Acidobacteriota bacterium]
MNDEYLFNRSGEDREIKQIEEKLAAFRYHCSDPPPLPAIGIVEETKRSFNWRWSFAFALPALTVLVFAGVIFFRSTTDSTERSQVTFIAAPEIKTETPTVPVPDIKIRPEPAAPRPASRRQSTSAGQILTARATRVRPKRRSLGNPQALTTFAGLSKKERYAYDQLMLALSISGSRLKIVKDAVNGKENASSRR